MPSFDLTAFDDLPQGIVITDPDILARYETDFRNVYRGRAGALLRPRNTTEVIACVTICAAQHIPLIPQGGNTSYCGAATPDPSGLQAIISFERMNSIREIDVLNRSVIVDAGAILSTVHDAVEAQGLMCPLSLGSRQSCQIGGNLSTNAGGLNVLRYGMARELVLGLEVVLPDGRLLETLDPLRKNNAGYNTDQMFIGAEGTLGLITGAALKLFPKPVQRVTAFLAVETLKALPDILRRAQLLTGEAISSFEYVSGHSLALYLETHKYMRAPLPTQSPHYILLEAATASPMMDIEPPCLKLLEDLMAEGQVIDGVIAASNQQRTALWDMREHIPESEVALGGSVKHDISVRTSHLPKFIQGASGLVEAISDARLSIYGHVGDGNVHFNLLASAAWSKQRIMAELSPRIYELAMRMGGSFSAEYGLGQANLDLNRIYGKPVKTTVMEQMKSALDPNNLFNPGKVISAKN
jgi:FAD/FMN-containing dehydrogenase